MIETHTGQGLTTVTLNRPDKANALTEEMLDALATAVGDSTSQVLILTGAGKVFSAGADLDAARAGLATSPLWERLSGAIAGYNGLTIAALNGTAAGGAMGMVLACDLRVATEGAKFFYPVMKLGFRPQPSDPARMTALVGPARAKRIFLTGERIDAAAAHQWGLVDHLCAPGTAVETAKTTAADALAATPAHVAALKSLHPLQ